MSANKKWDPIEYQLLVAKNMINDLQTFVNNHHGKVYTLGDSVYFENREHMDTSRLKITQIIEQLKRVRQDFR